MILYLIVALCWIGAIGVVAWATKDRTAAILALLGIVWPLVIFFLLGVVAFQVIRLAVFDR